MDDRVTGALRGCKNEDEVLDIFEKFQVNEITKKIDYLNSAMGNPETFYSSGNNIKLEEKYELLLQVFLTFAWKRILGL